METSRSILLDTSKSKLLEAPITSPYLFRGIVGGVLASIKEERLHLSVASRPSSSGFKIPQKKKRSAPSFFNAPPAKKQKQADFVVRKPSASAGFPSDSTPSSRPSNQGWKQKRGGKSGRKGQNRGRGSSSKTSYDQAPRDRP